MLIELSDEDRNELGEAILSAHGESAIKHAEAARLIRKLNVTESYFQKWLADLDKWAAAEPADKAEFMARHGTAN